jgi:hypothetical protein
MSALVLEALIKKLRPASKDALWKLTTLWLEDGKLQNRRLGAQMITIFLKGTRKTPRNALSCAIVPWTICTIS